MDSILLPLVFLVGAAVGAFLVWLTVRVKPAQGTQSQSLTGGPVGGGDVH